MSDEQRSIQTAGEVDTTTRQNYISMLEDSVARVIQARMDAERLLSDLRGTAQSPTATDAAKAARAVQSLADVLQNTPDEINNEMVLLSDCIRAIRDTLRV